MAKRGQALRKARPVKRPAKPVDDLKRENAALKRALAQERQRATATTEALAATADVLKAISRSTFDLQTVLDTLVESVTRLCEADHAWLFQREGEAFRWVASFGHAIEVHARLRDYFKSRQVPMDRGSLTGRAALETRVVHVPDVLADPEYTWSEAQNIGGYRAALGAPLVRKGEVIGVIFVAKTAPLPFAAKQIELVTTFADQAVIAIENARLITELHESEERHALVSRAVAEGIYEWEVERNGLWVSSRLIDIFGFYGRELRASDWNELVHPEDFPRYRTALRECFKRLTARLDCEYRVRHSDGQYRWIEDRGIPVRNNAGRAVRMVGAITDISERKATDQALREALEQQTATAEVLQVINSAPGNLAPVFDAVLGKALELCGAAFGILWTYDGGQMHAAALRGVPTAYAGFLTQAPHAVGENNAHDRLLHGERIVHIVDAADDKAYLLGDALRRATVDLGGSRTLLAVPLRKDNTFLGDFVIYRQEVRPFSDKQIALLESFAAQAVIAMENARLLGELRERTSDLEKSLEYQTATSDVLKVISGSAFDLQPVLDTVVETAAHLCDADFAGITLRDGEVYRYVALSSSTSPEYVAELRGRAFEGGRGSVAGRVALEGKVIHVADITADPEYDYAGAVNIGKIRTLLGVPMYRENAVVGVIGLSRQRVEPFTERQVELVRTFADQAVIAIENARLLGELRERTGDLTRSVEELTATSDVLKIISRSSVDLETVLDTLVETVARLCRADQANMFRRQEDVYHLVASRGLSEEAKEFLLTHPLTADRGTMSGRVELERRAVHIPDVLQDPEYTYSEGQKIQGYRTMLGIPLLREETLIGIFVIHRTRVEPFTDKEIELATSFADQAVIAIENARLFDELRERQAELARSVDELTATSDVLKIISRSSVELETVLGTMVETVARLCRADQAYLHRRRDDVYYIVAAHGVSEGAKEFIFTHPPTPDRGSIGGRVALERRAVQIHDVLQDPEYTYREAQKIAGFRTLLGVPLLRAEALVGILVVTRTHVDPFTNREIELVQTFADQAVIAIENARLFEELRERQAELRVTFDNMGDGVAMFDGQQRLAAWNSNFQQILDMPDALLARRLTYTDYLRILAERGEFGTEDIEAELSRRLQDTERELRLERTRPDGRVIEVRRNAVPSGGFVLIYADITERKRAEEAIRAARDAAETALRELQAAQASLVHAQKMAALGQLTAGIAHEIKNPLNFVNNFAGLSVELLDELEETAAQAMGSLDAEKRAELVETIGMLTGNLEKIAEHGRRADGIVKSMLQHSRGGSGERQPTDLNALVEEALNLAYHGARAQDQSFNITMERDLDRNLAPIAVVPQDVTRVFLNLIGNGFYAASKRSREGGGTFRPVLRVATRDLAEAVEIRVRDNGVGIAAEHREKLFQPFFTTKPTSEGTGLGLSISYEIVTQQHGGTITVESELGQFTEFTVRLPRRQHPSAGRAA